MMGINKKILYQLYIHWIDEFPFNQIITPLCVYLFIQGLYADFVQGLYADLFSIQINFEDLQTHGLGYTLQRKLIRNHLYVTM